MGELSRTRTIDEVFAAYYGELDTTPPYGEQVEQVEHLESTPDEALANYAASLAAIFNAVEDGITIAAYSPRRLIGCRAQGKWLLVLVTAICLILAVALFGSDVVISVLRLLPAIQGGYGE